MWYTVMENPSGVLWEPKATLSFCLTYMKYEISCYIAPFGDDTGHLVIYTIIPLYQDGGEYIRIMLLDETLDSCDDFPQSCNYSIIICWVLTQQNANKLF